MYILYAGQRPLTLEVIRRFFKKIWFPAFIYKKKKAAGNRARRGKEGTRARRGVKKP
jgi:hypothetical protein